LAALCLLAFVVLGYASVRFGEPAWLMGFEITLRGHSLLLAWILTWACYPYVLGPLYIASIVLAIVSPRWRAPAIAAIVVSLLCWRGADLFQHLFARPRRLDWLVRHETAFSYPSSHAALAVGFYFFWANVIRASRMRPWTRWGGFGLLALLTVAICWARLALGAHYLTDVLGGALLGGAVSLLALAVAARFGWELTRR
jgi:undecaprenyl-diphosphatase